MRLYLIKRVSEQKRPRVSPVNPQKGAAVDTPQ